MEKKVWISYSENLVEAIVRNIKLIETRQHKIRNLENWDLCIFERSENKTEAQKNFRLYCQNYRNKGLEILNREFKYKVWGSIEEDFRDNTKFLYYIWLGTKSRRVPLGIFEKALEGEKILKEFKLGQVKEFPASSKRLVIEYKGMDRDSKEYKRLFKS